MTKEKFPKPKLIYKYVDLETGKIILCNNTLKFSKPSNFNDPFDCDVNLLDFTFTGKIDKRVTDEIQTLKKMYRNYPNLNLDSKKNPFWETIYKETQLEKINSSRICCFSLINDNILMWSHYTNKHKGICLEFDNLFSHKFIELSEEHDITEGEVGYTANERINYIAEERKFAIYKLFMCKSDNWKYEKEFRMILLNNMSEFQKFRKGFLKAIYFGINTTNEERKQIIELCNQNGFKDLKFYYGMKGNLSITFAELFQ